MKNDPVGIIISQALCEDLCADFARGITGMLDGREPRFEDVTSDAVFGDERGEAQVIAKSSGILSGSVAFRRVFEAIDPELSVKFLIEDGRAFKSGDTVAAVSGRVKSILMGERTALNFLGHLSGIATNSRGFVNALGKSRVRILDTRKTLPGLRLLEKEAVVHGGGENHRMGLYDMVLVKDNHIDAAGSITEAVKRVRSRWEDKYRIEVETRNLAEVEEALRAKVDRIMLDNMPRRMVRRAVKLIGGRIEIEVSGNVTRRRVRGMRKLAVNYISAGSITSAAGHADFSLRIERAK